MTFYSVEDHGDLWEADANWDAEDLHNPGDTTTVHLSDRATAPGTPALVGRGGEIEMEEDLSPRWLRLWKMIQLHEEFWLDFFKTLTSSNDRKLAKEFLRKTWNPIYERFLILQPEYRGKDLPRDLRELSEGLSRARMVASTLRMPIPDIGSSGPFHGVSLSQSPISGETMSHVPASFRALCQAYVTDDGVLVASVELRNGKRYEASIALAPLAERIKKMIRRYHVEVLHGDMKEDTIAGLGDWFKSATDAAIRVAHSKAIKQVYDQALKNRKEILAVSSMIPGYGPAISAGLATGYKVHDAIVAAKGGDPKAYGQLQALSTMAKGGDPKAQQAWNSALAIKAAMDAKGDKQAPSTSPSSPRSESVGHGIRLPDSRRGGTDRQRVCQRMGRLYFFRFWMGVWSWRRFSRRDRRRLQRIHFGSEEAPEALQGGTSAARSCEAPRPRGRPRGDGGGI